MMKASIVQNAGQAAVWAALWVNEPIGLRFFKTGVTCEMLDKVTSLSQDDHPWSYFHTRSSTTMVPQLISLWTLNTF